MKALRYFGPRDIRYESMDDPAILDAGDAIVRVDRCGICGSDLHIYHGEGFSDDLGFCVGHEAVGEIVEAGRGVRRLKVGDRVMISAAVGCGACVSCLAGNVVNCANNASDVYGLRNRLQGSQAQAVRVPAADFNAAIIPDGITADQALMLTDGMPTAWFGCLNAGIRPGSSVAVVGLGPIGLIAAESAVLMGASRVFAIDRVAERRAVAEQLGATALGPAEAIEVLRDATAGRMIECVIEAVGADVTIALALRLAARRGTVSVLGVNHAKDFHFPMGRAFVKGLTFRIGTCSVPEHWPALIPLIQNGRLKPERYISHRLPLCEGPKAYALFDSRADGALKMVLVN